MIIHPQIEQRSREWFMKRAGVPTASTASRIVTASFARSGQWRDFVIDLCAEWLCPDSIADKWKGNADTERGNKFEPIARVDFEERTGFEVTEIGFITNDDQTAGCSPDGIIFVDGKPVAGVEIKCRRPDVQINDLLEGGLPKRVRPQIHWSMALTGLPWHYYSYCPGLKPLHILCQPDRNTAKVSELMAEFLDYYQSMFEEITQKATE